MKYAVVKAVNGNYFIHSEGITNLNSAKSQYFDLCSSLWNAPDVVTASAMIVDENLNTIPGYKEFISKVQET